MLLPYFPSLNVLKVIALKEMEKTWGDCWQGAEDGGSAAPGRIHHARGTQLRDGCRAQDAKIVWS